MLGKKLNKFSKQIILESAFDVNVKLYIYLFFLIALCLPFIFIVKHRGIIQVLAIISFLIISFIAIAIFFMKKGIVKDQNGLHIGYFSWKKLIYKYPITFKNLNVITLLKIRRKSRGAFASISQPDSTVSFNSFEIHLLNDKHTTKHKVIALKKENKANETIDFLTKHSKLRHEIYSPDFS